MRRAWFRLGLAAFGLSLGAAMLEGGLRLAGRGVRGQVGIFTETADGRIVLQPNATDRVRGPDGRITSIETDGAGNRGARDADALLRVEPLVVGDSQVFGLGVSEEETFAAQLGLQNAGVPDYGVVDTLASAERIRAAGRYGAERTVFVVVNQANDFEDGLLPLAERTVVRRGYLFRRDRLGVVGGVLWASPLGDSALFYTLWTRLNPVPPDAAGTWLTDPPSQVALAQEFAGRIGSFAANQSGRVWAVWLPADLATSEYRARESVLARGADVATLRPWTDTTLRDAFLAKLAADAPKVNAVDLTETLRDPAKFLPHDFHLSAAGHAAVATRLRAVLDPHR